MIDGKLAIYKHGKFEGIESVKRYAAARYPRWLDYSTYHCSLSGIEDEATDVLNEVMLSLLEKDIDVLERLYSTHQGQYTQLDFYILQMVKLNVHSATSPYQHKYKKLPVDREVNFQRLHIVDEPYEEIDKPAIILKQMRLVRWIFSGLDLSEFERSIFQLRFFEGNSLSEYQGAESRKKRYEDYWKVQEIIHYILFLQGMTKIKPKLKEKKKLTARQLEIVERWFKGHKISIKQSEYSNN